MDFFDDHPGLLAVLCGMVREAPKAVRVREVGEENQLLLKRMFEILGGTWVGCEEMEKWVEEKKAEVSVCD